MAREGAMMGVPSIYAGNRDMPANVILIKKKMLLKVDPTELVPMLNKMLDGELNFEDQVPFRNKLFEEWDDITNLILNKADHTIN